MNVNIAANLFSMLPTETNMLVVEKIVENSCSSLEQFKTLSSLSQTSKSLNDLTKQKVMQARVDANLEHRLSKISVIDQIRSIPKNDDGADILIIERTSEVVL